MIASSISQSTRNTMTIFVSKYALSSGIQRFDNAEESHTPTMVVVRSERGSLDCFHNDEWHLTEEDAKQRAEDMRIKKIASLKKQIAKLEKLSF